MNNKRGRRMDPLEAGAVHQAMPQEIIEHGARTVEQVQRGTDGNERPTQGTHATGRSDSGNRGYASPGRSHVGQAGNTHGDSDCRDAPHTEPLTGCEDTQTQGMLRQWPQPLNP